MKIKKGYLTFLTGYYYTTSLAKKGSRDEKMAEEVRR